MVEHLEPLIAAQTAALTATLEGRKPQDVSVVYAIDITGKEVSVCLACGIVGHDFQPTVVRQDNPEIDMMTESIAIFLESASRVGIKAGVMAYDDSGVFVLQAPGSSLDAAARAKIAGDFQKFKDRFAKVTLNNGAVRNGTVTDQNWLKTEAARWKPSDANRRVVGQPDDKHAAQVAKEMLAKADGVKGVVFMKSQVPRESLRGVEATLKSAGVTASGIAVGAQAQLVKASFFARTTVASNMHTARNQQAEALKQLLGQAK